MTTNEILDRYFKLLPPHVRIAKSRDIRQSLNITRSVLSDWRRGRTRLSAETLGKISEVVGADLSEDVAV